MGVLYTIAVCYLYDILCMSLYHTNLTLEVQICDQYYGLPVRFTNFN